MEVVKGRPLKMKAVAMGREAYVCVFKSAGQLDTIDCHTASSLGSQTVDSLPRFFVSSQICMKNFFLLRAEKAFMQKLLFYLYCKFAQPVHKSLL